MKKIICLIVCGLFVMTSSFSQNVGHTFGLRIGISLAALKKASGASLSLTYGIYRVPRENETFNLLPAYQLSFNSYLNGIGTNYTRNEIQFDLHHTLLLAAYSKKLKIGGLDIRPEFHYIDHAYLKNLSAIPLRSSTSFIVSTNYIINFKKRNQRYGSMIVQVGKFRIQHYNDGGFIFGNLKLGDDNDRWWSGGGFLEYGNDLPVDSIPNLTVLPRKIQIRFDRFTWNNQEGYEAANKNGLASIPIPLNKKEEAQYNFGRYTTTFFWDDFFIGIEANNKFRDLQDIVHEIGQLAKHPTLAPGYFSIGVGVERRYGFGD